MNYKKIYKHLIEKRKSNPITKGYKENHHILPKSLGGDNSKENLVTLTGREHWIAHLLLHKIYRTSQTAHACHMMAMRCDERGIPKIRNSRMYEWARLQCVKHWSKSGKKRLGEKNGAYGKIWICNIELKQSKMIRIGATIPDGWIKGRNKWIIKKSDKIHSKKCEVCGKKFKSKRKTAKFCSRDCFDLNRMNNNKWRKKENCKKEAIKYKTKKEFRENNQSAYAMSLKCKWLDEICEHMKKPKIEQSNKKKTNKKRRKWNKESCLKEALKYKTRNEFQNNSNGAYNFCLRRKWLDEVCVHMKKSTRKPRGYWTKDRCFKASLNYKTKSEFKKMEQGAYIKSKKKKWIDDMQF